MDVFNIKIEFDSHVFRDTVERYIKEKKKAYVCGGCECDHHRAEGYAVSWDS